MDETIRRVTPRPPIRPLERKLDRRRRRRGTDSERGDERGDEPPSPDARDVSDEPADRSVGRPTRDEAGSRIDLTA